MKRFRIGNEEIEVDVNLAHVLMSISKNGYNCNTATSINQHNYNHHHHHSSCDSFKILERPTQQVHASLSNIRMFECKTCNRQFPSFQALGGHRASHKRPKLMADHGSEVRIEPTKPRIHGCPICGLKFTIGQALGGHMRRHRTIADGFDQQEILEEKKIQEENTTLCLDLNLAPPGNSFPGADVLNRAISSLTVATNNTILPGAANIGVPNPPGAATTAVAGIPDPWDEDLMTPDRN